MNKEAFERMAQLHEERIEQAKRVLEKERRTLERLRLRNAGEESEAS